MRERAVIVVAGGGLVERSLRGRLPAGAPVVAADSGVDAAHGLGLRVDVVVGDLDSVSPGGLRAARAEGAELQRHPADKDATDLALALDAAAELLDRDAREGEQGGGEVVVVGVHGGRFDHLLAGVLALADRRHAGRRVRAHLGPVTVHVLHGPGALELDATPGELLTLVPVAGDADGVRTDGLRFALHGERLGAGTTRGVSNVVGPGGTVRVEVEAGTLLVVLPGEPAPNGGTP